MGLKGISWIEQNVEKVVAGVFGVALLGVVAMQFVGEGNAIELGGGRDKKKYSYDQVWDQVEEQARQSRAVVTSVEPDLAGIPEAPAVLSTFTGKLRGPLSPQPRLTAFDRPTLERFGDIFMPKAGSVAKRETFAAFTPPAPNKPVAASYLSTIHPQEVIASEELAKALGAKINTQDPAATKVGDILSSLDRASVTVEATYDGTALEAALLADPDNEGPASPMPRYWWDTGRIQVIGVELERQELGANGEWGAATKVDRMPGRLDLLKSIAEMESGGTAEGVVTFPAIMGVASKQRADVLRPTFYSSLLGEDWVAPSEIEEDLAAVTPGGGDAKAQGQKQLDEIDAEIVKAQEARRKLDEQPGRPGTEPPPPGPRGTTPPPPGGGRGGRPGGGDRDPGRDRTPQDPKEAQRKRLDERINRLALRREKVIEKYREAGVELEQAAAAPAPAAPPTPTAAANAPATPMLADPEVRLWAHDINVQRGKTYRYRTTLVLNNPIYGKQAALDEKQVALAKNPLVRTAPSDWSDPVRVDPETFYFITSATPEDSFAPSARASAEVFVFSMGYWRRGQVNLEPGDIIATDVKVPDPVKLAAMIAMDPNAVPQPGIQPAPGPRGLPPVPGPRGVAPDERGGRPGLQPPMPGNDPNAPNGEAIDPATILVSKAVAEEALLLDVASTTVVSEQGIAKTKTENQAFLLNEDGQIVVRTPDGDRNATAYLRLLRSAERGEQALRPKVVRPENLPRPMVPTEPGRENPGGAPGGGGG